MASPLLLLSSQVVTPCLNLPDVFIDYAAAFPAHLHNNITLASLPKTRPVGPFGTGVDASRISIKIGVVHLIFEIDEQTFMTRLGGSVSNGRTLLLDSCHPYFGASEVISRVILDKFQLFQLVHRSMEWKIKVWRSWRVSTRQLSACQERESLKYLN